MGPLALVGAGLTRLADTDLVSKKQWLQTAIRAALLLILGLLSWHRASAYENEETLEADTLAKNPGSWLSRNNLGVALLEKGRVNEAMVQYQKALAIKPDFAEAHNNLGIVFTREGNLNKAIAQFQEAVRLRPDYGAAQNNLAAVKAMVGQKNR